ncbi:MAG: CNNM domain-containing protein, partial [Actinomycetales bacterium]
MSAIDAWAILGAVLLVLIAGLLVSAETALGRVSRGHVEELRRDNPKAARLLHVIDDRPRFVNVLLFLSTAATVTATVLVGWLCLDVLAIRDGWPVAGALAAAVAIMVVVSYVALGVAPRTLGRQHADRIALAAAGPATFLATVLGPL